MKEPTMGTFAKVVVIALVVIAGIGVLIHEANAGKHRPSGFAERWLSAVSDTGRPGLRDDAVERVERLGSVDLAKPLIPGKPEDRHGYFSDLEVGKATRLYAADLRSKGAIFLNPERARVPFRLHQNVASSELRKGTLVLQRAGTRWRVIEVDRRRFGELVPSEGGPRPSRAPVQLWIGAVIFGVLLALASHGIVRYADRTARRATAGAGR